MATPKNQSYHTNTITSRTLTQIKKKKKKTCKNMKEQNREIEVGVRIITLIFEFAFFGIKRLKPSLFSCNQLPYDCFLEESLTNST